MCIHIWRQYRCRQCSRDLGRSQRPVDSQMCEEATDGWGSCGNTRNGDEQAPDSCLRCTVFRRIYHQKKSNRKGPKTNGATQAEIIEFVGATEGQEQVDV